MSTSSQQAADLIQLGQMAVAPPRAEASSTGGGIRNQCSSRKSASKTKVNTHKVQFLYSYELRFNKSSLSCQAMEKKMTMWVEEEVWRMEIYISVGIIALGLLSLLAITSLPSIANSLNWREFSFIQVRLPCANAREWFCSQPVLGALCHSPWKTSQGSGTMVLPGSHTALICSAASWGKENVMHHVHPRGA